MYLYASWTDVNDKANGHEVDGMGTCQEKQTGESAGKARHS
jgi:hypothetical protein